MSYFKKLKKKLLEGIYDIASNVEDRLDHVMFDDDELDDNDDDDEDEVYMLTPKGIISVCMIQCRLTDNYDDPRINGFFTLFESLMRECGYVHEGDSRNEN